MRGEQKQNQYVVVDRNEWNVLEHKHVLGRRIDDTGAVGMISA